MLRVLVLVLVALAPSLALADNPREEMRQALDRHAETEILVQSLPGIPPGRPAQVRRPAPEARAVAAESAARVLRSETASAVAAQVRSAAKTAQAAAGQAAAKAALDSSCPSTRPAARLDAASSVGHGVRAGSDGASRSVRRVNRPVRSLMGDGCCPPARRRRPSVDAWSRPCCSCRLLKQRESARMKRAYSITICLILFGCGGTPRQHVPDGGLDGRDGAAGDAAGDGTADR